MAPFPIHALEIDNYTTLISFLVVQSIYTFILCPLTIFYAHKLWKLHKDKVLFISKRRPQNVIFGILLLNFYPIIVRPFTDLPRIWSPAQKYNNIHLRVALADVIILFLYGLFSRAWLLYYDYEHCMQSISIQWEKHISKQQNYIPWTLKYKFLGNTKIIFIITIIFWIIAMLIIQFSIFIMGDHSSTLTTISVAVPAILGSIIIAFKIRKWNDVFYLKRELQLCAFVCCMVMIIFASVLMPFMDYTWNIRLIIGNIIVCGWCYSLAFISSQWVIRRYQKQCVAEQSEKQLSLEDILSTEKGFKLFANYLVKEFSIEHLFFLYNIMNLKNELIATEMINRKDAGIVITMKYMDNKQIKPKTFKEIKATMKYIVSQYIEIESEYSVNISWRIRQNILKLLWDEERTSNFTISMEEISPRNGSSMSFKEMDERMDGMDTVNTNSCVIINDFDIAVYLKKFDGAIEEVIKLLTCDSLGRFYESYEYQQMIKHVKHDVID